MMTILPYQKCLKLRTNVKSFAYQITAGERNVTGMKIVVTNVMS